MAIKIIKEKIRKKKLRDRWYKMSLAEQMGNIGAEVFRMIDCKEKKDRENEKNCFIRTFKLLDLTIEQRKNKELLRLREVIYDLFSETNFYRISIKSLKDYFLFFALFRKRVNLDLE